MQRLDRKGLNLMAAVVALVTLLDQVTKVLVTARLHEGAVVPVMPGFFNLTFVLNPGVAFGMLADLTDQARQWVLAGTTLLAVSAVIYFLLIDYYHDRIAQCAIALILGGATGNVIDRLRIGRVIDFLDFYVGNAHWPAFNVADSAICVGVVILLCRRPAHRQSATPVETAQN